MVKRLNKTTGLVGIVIAIILAFIPDPSDVLDAGLPLLELGIAYLISRITNFKN